MCRNTDHADSSLHTAAVTKPIKRNDILLSDINECLPNPGAALTWSTVSIALVVKDSVGTAVRLVEYMKELGVYSD